MKRIVASVLNMLFKEWKARDCRCVNMVDVGAYNSCLHGCKYCYANFDSKQIVSNYKMHDVNSSLLIGQLNLDDQIKIKWVKSIGFTH